MAVKLLTFPTREEWLKARGHTIGGSDASAVIGRNPYMSNIDLWEYKTGRKQQEDISEKPYVEYGTKAEEHLRELFRLDFPQYRVEYIENNMWLNDKYPWAHFSADGWMYDIESKLGGLEIKTTEILRSMQKELWRNQVPNNYFVQLLHGMAIMQADYFWLKGQLKTIFDDVPYLQTKHYNITRSEVHDQVEYLMEEEEKFFGYVQRQECPPLLLPDII